MLETPSESEKQPLPESYEELKLQGQAALDSKDFDLAKVCFERMLELEPENPDGYNALGLYYRYIEDDEKSEAFYYKALALDSTYFKAYYNLGSLYRKQGLLERSLEQFERVLALDPSILRAVENAAEISGKLRQYEKAEEYYRTLSQAKPGDLGVKTELATCLSGQQKNEEALAILLEIKKNNPEECIPVGLFCVLGGLFYRMGFLRDSTGCFEQACECFEKYIFLDPEFGLEYRKLEDIEILVIMLEIYNILFRHDKLDEFYQKILILDPENKDAKLGFAKSMFLQKNYNDALSILLALEKNIAEKEDSPQVFSRIGDIYYQMALDGKNIDYLKKAVLYFQKYLEIDSNSYEDWKRLAHAHSIMRNYLLSSEALEQALSIDGSHFEDWLLLGEAYRNLEVYDKAIEALLKSNEMKENDLSYFYLSWVCYLKNDFEKTIEYAEKSLHFNPQEPAPYQILALVYLYREDAQQYVLCVQNALRRKENSVIELPGNFAILGRLLKEKGYLEIANECFEADSFVRAKHQDEAG